ncbi:MAG TPA: cadherin-like domain-containing protein, partial [Gemmataceae bacterium]|nr:cadherin-like domain-containing protein [Gemmataceae bacterium]
MARPFDLLLRFPETSRKLGRDAEYPRRVRANVARGGALTLEQLEERLTPSGETVTATFGAIPVQKTVQVSFDGTIDSPLAKGIDRVFNQGSVSGSAFATIKTDASQSPGTGDVLVTPVERAPMVAGVYLRSSSWTPAFLGNLQAQGLGDTSLGYVVPNGAGQSTSIPWPNLDRVSVRFTSDVNIAPGALSILGTYNASYPVNTAVLSYDSATFTATWALTTPLVADGLRLIVSSAGVTGVGGNAPLDGEWLDDTATFPSGNGAAGTDFSFRFNVVPGDVNRDGVSSSADMLLVRQGFGGIQVTADVNGDGTVTASDLDLARSLVGKGLIVIPPGGQPGSGWVPTAATPTPPNPTGGRGTTVTARVESFLLVDVDRDGRADPGDTVRYIVSIRNFGTVPTSATLTDTLDPYMTLVPGSVRLSPVAFDDHYTMTPSAPLTIAAATGVLANDVDFNNPAQTLSVVTAGTTQQFDQVTVNSDGSFSFTPATGAKGPRTFFYTLRNTSGMVSVGSATVEVANAVPVLAGIESTSFTYTQGGPPTPITASLTVSDTDDPSLAGATVAIAGGTYVSGQDVLTFANQNGITGNFNPSTGVMALSGTSSLANYQAALRSVRYANTSGSPNVTSRIVTFAVTDGFASSNTVSRTATVLPAAAASFTVTAPTAVNPGTPFSITVTAKDAFNNTAKGYSGTIHFTHSDFNESASVPGDYTFVVADQGTHTFTNGVTLVTPGLQTVTATDTVSAIVHGTSNSIIVDARPIARNDNFTAVGNTELRVGTGPAGYAAAVVSGSLLDNDSDPDGNLPITVTNVSTVGLQGSLTISPNGTFTFLPNVGYAGSTSFTYRVMDSAGNVSALAVTATITIDSRVWYVNNAYAGGNGPSDGTGARPFTALTSLNGAGGSGDLDGPDDFIFVDQGSGMYADGLEMEAGQKLYGQPFGLTISGYTLVAAGGGLNPTITNAAGAGIVLAEGVDVQWVNVANTLGDGIAGPDGLNFATVGPNMSVTNAGQKGFRLFGGAGTISFGADISGSGSETVYVTGRTGGSVTVSGNLTSGSAADGIFVAENSGGAVVTFSGAKKLLSSGAFAGVVISGNNAATVSFTNGGLNIDTTSGHGVLATGGGTLNISGSGNTIRTQTGIALKVEGVSIGGAGLTFLSVSAGSFGAGPDHAIYLVDTGGVAGLTITGDGLTKDSGGIISSTNFEAVYLVDTVNVDLNCLTVSGTGFDMAGIYASGVNGFTLDRGVIVGTGCDGITFDSTVSGDVTIKNTNFLATGMDGLYAYLSSGAADWTISNCIFDNCGNDAIAFVGTIDGTVSIVDTTAGGSWMAGLSVAQFAGSADWTISDSFFVGSGCDGLSFAGDLNGSVTITNTFVSGSAMWGLYAELDGGTS